MARPRSKPIEPLLVRASDVPSVMGMTAATLREKYHVEPVVNEHRLVLYDYRDLVRVRDAMSTLRRGSEDQKALVGV